MFGLFGPISPKARTRGRLFMKSFGRLFPRLGWLSIFVCSGVVATAEDSGTSATAIPESVATHEDYNEPIRHTDIELAMVAIPGGSFTMGSSSNEADHHPSESPPHEVTVRPFWMSRCEITWDLYDTWGEGLDQLRRQMLGVAAGPTDAAVDGVTKPTEPYTDMSFGMGKGNYPAICMTQHAARTFCRWLSVKTGHYYRLPTEAEWEYACRAGTTTAYSFGDDPDELKDHAWFFDNSDDVYQEVGLKRPNPWGLFDMHGNVAEWVLDQYSVDFYAESDGSIDPLLVPTTLYPRVVRGGSYLDDPDRLRSAAREASAPEWKDQDPQEPRSIWYHTDALGVGFRVVRPCVVPGDAERQAKWDRSEPIQLDPID